MIVGMERFVQRCHEFVFEVRDAVRYPGLCDSEREEPAKQSLDSKI